MKAFTDISQSKKLAEILPLESADMWFANGIVVARGSVDEPDDIKSVIPAWSLAALLDVLPYPQLSKDKLGSGRVGWMVSVYPDNCRYDSCWHDNQVDACYEMISKLHELNLL